MMHFTAPDVRRRRMRNSYLATQARGDELAKVVEDVCCVQAQILSTAQLALGLRVRNGTLARVERAMWRDRALVKTYGPRNTLHLVAAEHYGLWMGAMRAAYNLPDRPDRLSEAVGESLDGRILTRRELADCVARRLGSAAPAGLGSTWGDHLRAPAYHGLLCFAEAAGPHVRFARADQWISGWEHVDGEPALLEICRRYIRAYGPTTPRGFAQWLLIGRERAEGLFARLGPVLDEARIGRTRAWVVKGDAQPDLPPRPQVRLVPQYDPYLLNSQPRGGIVSDEARRLVRTFGQGRNEGAVGVPLVLLDGEVAGIWQHRQEGGRLIVLIDAFVPRDADFERGAESESRKVGRFYGKASDLRFSTLAKRG